MKANLRNSFAKRSLVIAATALPTLCAGVASAQPAPAAEAPAPQPAPGAPLPPPVAGTTTPPSDTATTSPGAVVVPEATTQGTPAPMAPEVPPPPPDPEAEKYKHINMGVWMRVGAALQKAEDPKKLGGFGLGGTVELHMSNQMRKDIQWTANLIGTFGAADGGSFNGAPPPPGTNGGTSSVAVLDLIAQYEPNPAFNFWVGRMLVASDRSNFSGPWFMAPWSYPLFLGPQGAPYAVVGPKEGPFGRNDGATVWGQFAGGTFKYYLGAYNTFHSAMKPLISGRLNLALLNPEPGFYSSSTYYGMDILAIGVGGQYQKNGDAVVDAGTGAITQNDYGMFNADILFEKNLGASGVVDVEGAFYKYVGDLQPYKLSYMALASYLTPDMGVGKFQPLVRLQQADFKADGVSTVTQIDAQVGYVVDNYATRFALGFSHGSAGEGVASNALFAGVQLQK